MTHKGSLGPFNKSQIKNPELFKLLAICFSYRLCVTRIGWLPREQINPFHYNSENWWKNSAFQTFFEAMNTGAMKR